MEHFRNTRRTPPRVPGLPGQLDSRHAGEAEGGSLLAETFDVYYVTSLTNERRDIEDPGIGPS